MPLTCSKNKSHMRCSSPSRNNFSAKMGDPGYCRRVVVKLCEMMCQKIVQCRCVLCQVVQAHAPCSHLGKVIVESFDCLIVFFDNFWGVFGVGRNLHDSLFGFSRGLNMMGKQTRKTCEREDTVTVKRGALLLTYYVPAPPNYKNPGHNACRQK